MEYIFQFRTKEAGTFRKGHETFFDHRKNCKLKMIFVDQIIEVESLLTFKIGVKIKRHRN